MKYQITDQQHAYFIGRCEYWKQVFLVAFDLNYERVKTTDYMAQTVYSLESHMATIKLPKVWEVEPTDINLDKTALHEIAHLLLAPVMELCYRYYATEHLGEREHGVIISLENIAKELKNASIQKQD